MISWNELGDALVSVLPVSIVICMLVMSDMLDDWPIELIRAAFDVESDLAPMVTPFAVTSVPSGSWLNTENFTSYVYWMPVSPTYWRTSLLGSSRYFLKSVRLFFVMLLVRLEVCLMLRSSG